MASRSPSSGSGPPRRFRRAMVAEQELEEIEELDEEPGTFADDEISEALVAEGASEPEGLEDKFLDLLEDAAGQLERLEADDSLSALDVQSAHDGFESFATALITMKEAKVKTAEARKARG